MESPPSIIYLFILKGIGFPSNQGMTGFLVQILKQWKEVG